MSCNPKALVQRAVLLAPVLLTAACASVPNLGEAPHVRPASDYAAAVSLAPDGSAWPDQGWWHRYEDPQLDQLIDEALIASPDLAAAAARLRTAQGYVQAAGAPLFPAIDAVATGDVRKQEDARLTSQGTAGFALSFDLDLWGKNRAALAAATSEAEAAGYDLAEARLTLTTSIASTYATLAQLYRERDTLESALQIRTETLKLVNQRVVIGLDTRAASKQAEGRVFQSRDDLVANAESIQLTRNALAALLGQGPDRGQTIERPSVVAFRAQGIPENASIALIGRRPDIAAYRALVEANAQRVKQARAAFYPDISLTALAGLSTIGVGELFSSSATFGSVSPAVTLPLFHGGALSGQYRGARGQYDEAVAIYNGQVISALQETANAVASRKALDGRLVESRRALAEFEEANRLARLRYEGGLSTYLDVLSAEESLIGARLTVADLETRALVLDVALVRALGGGFTA